MHPEINSRNSFAVIGIVAVAFAAVGLLAMMSGRLLDTPGDLGFMCILAAPCFLVIAIVILACLGSEMGKAELSNGDVETLLSRKREGTLAKGATQTWADVPPLAPVKSEPQTHIMAGLPEAGDPLDRLVRRKRLGGLGRRE